MKQRIRILFCFGGGIGPMIRCLPAAIELKTKGYDIFYYVNDNSDKYMRIYEFNKFTVKYRRRNNAGIGLTPYWIDMEHFASTYENDQLYFNYKYSKWLREISRLKPDVIVSDNNPGSLISAKILGIPTVSISQACYLFPLTQKRRIRWWDTIEKPDNICVLNSLNTFLSKNRAEPLQIYEQIYLGNITLIPSFPEFDAIDSLDSNIQFVGPIFWNGNQSNTDPVFEKEKKRIFLYLGRLNDYSGNSGEILLQAIEKSELAQEYDIHVSTGGMDELSLLKNSRLKPVDKWLSIREIYENYSFVIHHGGHNSCLGSFVFGIPSFALPTHSEREFNARNLQALGAGRYSLPEQHTLKQMKGIIESFLSDTSIPSACQTWKMELEKRSYLGSDTIVDAINNFVKSS